MAAAARRPQPAPARQNDDLFSNAAVDEKHCMAAVRDVSGKFYVQCKNERSANSEYCRWHKGRAGKNKVIPYRVGRQAGVEAVGEADQYEKFLVANFNFLQFDVSNLRAVVKAYIEKAGTLTDSVKRLLDRVNEEDLDLADERDRIISELAAQLKAKTIELTNLRRTVLTQQTEIGELQLRLEQRPGDPETERELKEQLNFYVAALSELREGSSGVAEIQQQLSNMLQQSSESVRESIRRKPVEGPEIRIPDPVINVRQEEAEQKVDSVVRPDRRARRQAEVIRIQQETARRVRDEQNRIEVENRNDEKVAEGASITEQNAQLGLAEVPEQAQLVLVKNTTTQVVAWAVIIPGAKGPPYSRNGLLAVPADAPGKFKKLTGPWEVLPGQDGFEARKKTLLDNHADQKAALERRFARR